MTTPSAPSMYLEKKEDRRVIVVGVQIGLWDLFVLLFRLSIASVPVTLAWWLVFRLVTAQG